MIAKKENTAILIFCRTSNNETRQKNLIPWDKTANRRSTQYLNKQVEIIAKKSQLPYFIITEQKGNSFGEKLSYAFTQVFDKGYKHAIAVGNDCPDLKVSDLAVASRKLTSGISAIGPDTRNGAYLIGLSKDQFKPEIFSKIKWQSDRTLDSIKNFTKDYHLLPTKIDLNNSAEFEAFWNNASKKIKRLISSFFEKIKVYLTEGLDTGIYNINSNNRRGPPITTLIHSCSTTPTI